MAYAFTITPNEGTFGGRRSFIVVVNETEAATADEFEIDNFPFELATLVKYKATKGAGAGATIKPKLGYTSGWTANTQDDIGTNTTTDVHIDDETHLIIRQTTGSIFVKSQVDSGADNVIDSILIFVEGVL